MSALHQSLQVRIFLAEENGRIPLTSAFCVAMGHIILPVVILQIRLNYFVDIKV